MASDSGAAGPAVIGRLVFKGGDWEALLRADGTWVASTRALENYLNAVHNPRRGYSPTDGAFGHRALRETAAALRAEVTDLEEVAAGGEERVH